MRTYIKKNSHTQQAASKGIQTTNELCARLEISKEQWLQDFFEYGCRFVELTELFPERLTNEVHGFWAMFLSNYLKHDQIIIEAFKFSKLTYEMYTACKEDLINPQPYHTL